ncbi:MAG: Fe-S-containing protein [Bifidobacteriaceae bacterium]|nr:Fe-S-containing protein [Bifidobacteriaceae bacterium]
MLGQFIAVIQGLAPTALVLAVLVVTGRALAKTAADPAHPVSAKNGGRSGPRVALRPAAWGSGAGALAGAALAALRESALLLERETIAAWTAGAVIAALATLIVATWLAKSRAPLPAPPRVVAVWNWSSALVAALLLVRALPSVFLQFTSFVVPGEPVWSTDAALRVVGFLGGATLVGLAASALVRASQGADVRVARATLYAAGGLAALSAAINLIQIATARQLISLPRGAFKVLVWAINHQTVTLAAVAAVGLILPLSMLRSNLRRSVNEPNPAAARLVKATKRRRLRYALATSGAYVALGLALTVGVALDQREVELSPPEPYELAGTVALVPLSLVDDGHLHRFAYTTEDGTVVRFIVIKKNGVAYGVGLDACEVCGATGYYERDGKIVCRLCDVIMNIATIGFKGGCNPIPLEYTLDGGNLLVQTADLEAAASIFA